MQTKNISFGNFFQRLSLFLFPFAITLTSCSNKSEDILSSYGNDDTREPVMISIFDSDYDTTVELAEIIADNILGKQDYRTRSQESTDISVINDSKGNPAIYVVNYGENGGFALISADKKFSPVLAFSESGHFDTENMEQTSAGYWLSRTLEGMENPVEIPDSIENHIAMEWRMLSTKLVPFVNESRSTDAIDPRTTMAQAISIYQSQGYTVYQVANTNLSSFPEKIRTAANSLNTLQQGEYNVSEKELALILEKKVSTTPSYYLKTMWGRFSPYNFAISMAGYGVNKSLGCVPIAIAQIMKYYGKPTSYDFSIMPNTLTISNVEQYLSLPRFLMKIGEECGIDYKTDDSGVNYMEAMQCLDKNGYNSDFINYDSEKIKSQLTSGRPVIIFGLSTNPNIENHAWVSDGVYNSGYATEYQLKVYTGDFADISATNAYMTKTSENISVTGTVTFHMNWGESGKENGWYTMSGPWTALNTVYNPYQALINIYYKN